MTICRPDKILNSHPACFVRFFCRSKQNICSSSKPFLDFLQLIALVKQVRSLIDMHQVIGAGPFLYAYLREVWFCLSLISRTVLNVYRTFSNKSPGGLIYFKHFGRGEGGLLERGDFLNSAEYQNVIGVTLNFVNSCIFSISKKNNNNFQVFIIIAVNVLQ